MDNVIQIAAGKSHVLALTYKGTIFGWGSNKHGQLGVNSKDIPCVITPHEITVCEKRKDQPKLRVRQIYAGKHHSLAIMADNSLYFWGDVMLTFLLFCLRESTSPKPAFDRIQIT